MVYCVSTRLPNPPRPLPPSPYIHRLHIHRSHAMETDTQAAAGSLDHGLACLAPLAAASSLYHGLAYLALPALGALEAVGVGLVVHEGLVDVLLGAEHERPVLDDGLVER